MDIGEIANHFEDLVVSRRMRFKVVPAGQLDQFTQLVIEAFLTEQGLEWQLGNKMIAQAVCLKIKDPYLQYLDVYPEQQRYQWCTDEHQKGVMPHDAMKYLIERFMPGVKIKPNADGSISINDLRLKVKR